jgi:hypothetical protein
MCKGETIYLLAGGPSLQGFDPKPLKGKTVITINDSWRVFPGAKVHYFCDHRWWQDQIAINRRSLDGLRDFHEMIYKGFWVAGNYRFADHPQVRCLMLSGQCGLEKDPGKLCHGSNSGYQAINLAYHLGAKRVVLLGYDMKVAPNGRTHWHNENRPDDFGTILMKSMLPPFNTLVEPLKEAKVEVINATPDSALTCWPYRPLMGILESEELS